MAFSSSVSGPGFFKMAIGRAYLSYVMQEAGNPEAALGFLGDSNGPPQLYSKFGVLLRILSWV